MTATPLDPAKAVLERVGHSSRTPRQHFVCGGDRANIRASVGQKYQKRILSLDYKSMKDEYLC